IVKGKHYVLHYSITLGTVRNSYMGYGPMTPK
ncbi:unnamed protein product, partial [Clonostachys rosea f. rosea IK726]